MFYSVYINSVISFSIICWQGNLAMREKNSQGRNVHTTSKVARKKFRSLDNVFNIRALKKVKAIFINKCIL